MARIEKDPQYAKSTAVGFSAALTASRLDNKISGQSAGFLGESAGVRTLDLLIKSLKVLLFLGWLEIRHSNKIGINIMRIISLSFPEILALSCCIAYYVITGNRLVSRSSDAKDHQATD